MMRCLGGSIGSTGISCIWMMRWLAPLFHCSPCCLGVYLMYWGAPGASGRTLAWLAASLAPTFLARAAMVSSATRWTSSSSGRDNCRGIGGRLEVRWASWNPTRASSGTVPSETSPFGCSRRP